MRAVAIVSSPLQKLGLGEIISEFNGVVVLDIESSRLRALMRAIPLLVLRSRPHALVLGDIYSRLGQFLTVLIRCGRLIVLEDGADSHRALSLWGAGLDLTRAHQRRRRHILESVFRRKFDRLSSSGKVEWIFSGAPLFPCRTANVRTHNFVYLKRAVSRPIHLQHRRLVLGSALASDGFVFGDFYRQWLAGFDEQGTIIWPHRRESKFGSEILAPLRAGLVSPEGCVEATAARWCQPVEVVALPTSCFLTLPQILPVGSRVTGYRIPSHWWTSRATNELKRLSESLLERADSVVEIV